MHTIIPTEIRLEASSACQLKCPSCPTATKANRPTIGQGHLNPADFERLLDDNPQIRKVELGNYGEMFLNPKLLEIMRIADDRAVELLASTGVNLNSVRDDVLEGLVKHGFRYLNCSIDGASIETYGQYRVGGNYDTVIANIRKINAYKKRFNSRAPKLQWQFIAFGHNEHEIQAAQALARDLGMSFKIKLSWDEEFSPIKNREELRKLIGAATRQEYREAFGVNYLQTLCRELWRTPTVNWDGKILGCSRNFWQEFGGNAFDDGLEKAVNGSSITYARKMLQGIEPERADIPCTACENYREMKESGSFLSYEPPPVFKPFISSLLWRLGRYVKRWNAK